MVCKFGCHERGKSSTPEAKTKSDSQVGRLMNVAKFKANSISTKLGTDNCNKQS